MLKIRLMKPGKSVKRRYHFKVVVAEARTPRDSKFVEQIGYYDPLRKISHIDLERYDDWIKKGAKPTATVASLAKKYRKETKSS